MEKLTKIDREAIQQVTAKKIWEVLKEGRSFSEFVEQTPDELFKWVKDKETELKNAYNKILDKALTDFIHVGPLDERKYVALDILECDNPHILFAMLNGKNYRKLIWDMLEPEHEVPEVSLVE